ncbi:nucleotide exchange factor GrpE [Candidatus Minimicrobia naudis]|uniref:Nucleotide exchange factor GrpE n=1 Tax=Candidatus Minimicrobia naudis TaxID=2841263 RepID=A0A8F1MBT4_9BACT|nr:nucleotide exchange factor GrpE [Candidatus Minimicrobia naudis]
MSGLLPMFQRNSQDNAWVKGVAGLNKQLDKQLKEIGLEKIDAKPGTLFNPEFHQAVQFDESADE